MNHKKQTVLDAFIEQTYGSAENIRKADLAADHYHKHDNDVLPLDELSKLSAHSFGDTDIRSRLNIPTQNPKIFNDNSGQKQAFKGYDFGLDKKRDIGLKNMDSQSDGVEWGELHDPSVGNWEIE